MNNREQQVWDTVHKWCNDQYHEIPDANRRALMDMIMEIVEPKTVKEWLEQLDEPYRSRALKNCINPDIESGSLSEALAFVWVTSPEDAEYWSRLYIELDEKNL